MQFCGQGASKKWFLDVAEGLSQDEGMGSKFTFNTYWKNHATAKVMNAESFCCSEMGLPKQLVAELCASRCWLAGQLTPFSASEKPGSNLHTVH